MKRAWALLIGLAATIPQIAQANEATRLVSDDLWRVLLLRDYNTRIVLLGVLLLGVASGIIGTFTLLRKRALVGDAASHATLPGIALAFIFMTMAGGEGKFLPGLMLGALLSGLAGMGAILIIRHTTKLKEDAALGIVLSVFFGFGMALLGVIQKMRAGHAAGLESFIYGKTASMLAFDAWLLAGMAAIVTVACILLLKELALLCFDQEYALSRGYPIRRLDALLMWLIVLTVVTGLQAVGLILMIALLIIPAAAARFWTHDLKVMLLLAAGIGGISSVSGAVISALQARMPAGAVIVVMAGICFIISMVFGRANGVWYRALRAVRLRTRTADQHVLRLLYEWREQQGERAMPRMELQRAKSWSRKQLRGALRRVQRKGLVRDGMADPIHLTANGITHARQIVRNHRLWEAFLIRYAHIARHHVDHNADRVEHILDPHMIAELEQDLAIPSPGAVLPRSPHPLNIPEQER